MSKLSESQKQEIKEIIADKLCVDVERVLDDSVIQDDLYGDSLDEVDIMMALESKFDISVPDLEYEGKQTVQRFFDVVERYIQ